MLKIVDLHVEAGGREILKGVNLTVNEGEFHVIMGPNGSGKSTLALTLAGHPNYKVTKGGIFFEDKEITNLTPDERAKMGILLAFQVPPEIQGVRIIDFLTQTLSEIKNLDASEAYNIIIEKAKELWFREDDLRRYINVGFSGGERKRLELLQALLLEPKLLILDEPDSGVDVDSLSVISRKIEELHKKGVSIILITHYGRIFGHIDKEKLKVNIMRDGKIVMRGGSELISMIEEKGFKAIFGGDNDE
ncbi:Fe-S cluster assembly ATPase SufC [Pyrococcus horikoshii]|uniref:Fe-S cluster assembly ATPase SufC n=2 Tax=Pyrococcus horikoshii TaxID=53953 RepID=A0A832SLR0_PYRHR|nr:Fe-S cluster assembly ATPase SufC [Pyrococcus horikoshii]BAA30490.1 247aa long hypothetical ATP-dependent transporter YCF16 [Pyrococcus horikoshii OT3]HII60387.1 Fe-S cluster assembly ATPase SufC [Pyrococcus horikoshii]